MKGVRIRKTRDRVEDLIEEDYSRAEKKMEVYGYDRGGIDG